MQIDMALELIARLDGAMDTRVLSSAVLELRRTLNRKLLGLSSLERTIARQKLRLLHLKDGMPTPGFPPACMTQAAQECDNDPAPQWGNYLSPRQVELGGGYFL